jgi:hypothetical protein
MLRHRDSRINQHTKARYHARLRALGPSFTISTAAEEQSDPRAADELYTSAVDEVRRRAKVVKDLSVHRENVSYGFTRNLLALKPIGLALSGGALIVFIAVIFLRGGSWATVGSSDVTLAAALSLYTVAWLFLVRQTLVLHHAESYALTLFEFIQGQPEPKKRGQSG